MTDWPKITLLRQRRGWWRWRASDRRREWLKWKATGDRSHYWHDYHERRGEHAAAKKNEAAWPGIRKEIAKWAMLLNEAEREVHRYDVALAQLEPKAQLWLAGGWVRPGTPFWMQRQDQGQDFEIPLGHSVVAPGDGHCLQYSADRPFPFGFGDPYAVVRIETGRFAGEAWYLGHANEPIIRPGEHFTAGQALARLDHSLNPGRGWIEIGHWPPGSMSEGERWHRLFAPLWR